MPLTTEHKAKIERWLHFRTASNDIARSNISDVLVLIYDNMALLNNETTLDTNLALLEATKKAAEIVRLKAKVVELNILIANMEKP